MPFEDLEPPVKLTGAGTVAMVRFVMGPKGRPRLLIRRELFEQIPGALRFKVQRGTMADSHLLRLTRADDGNFQAVATPGKSNPNGPPTTFVIRLPKIDRWPEDEFKAVECTYEVQNKRILTINLPPALWRNPQPMSAAKRAA